MYSRHSLHLHFAGQAGHAWSAHGAGDAAYLAIGLLEQPPGIHQRDPEIMLSAGIAHHEQVVGNTALLYLLLPHLRPECRSVVDVAQQGRLGADLRSGFADTLDCLGNCRRVHLPGM